MGKCEETLENNSYIHQQLTILSLVKTWVTSTKKTSQQIKRCKPCTLLTWGSQRLCDFKVYAIWGFDEFLEVLLRGFAYFDLLPTPLKPHVTALKNMLTKTCSHLVRACPYQPWAPTCTSPLMQRSLLEIVPSAWRSHEEQQHSLLLWSQQVKESTGDSSSFPKGWEKTETSDVQKWSIFSREIERNKFRFWEIFSHLEDYIHPPCAFLCLSTATISSCHCMKRFLPVAKLRTMSCIISSVGWPFLQIQI